MAQESYATRMASGSLKMVLDELEITDELFEATTSALGTHQHAQGTLRLNGRRERCGKSAGFGLYVAM